MSSFIKDRSNLKYIGSVRGVKYYYKLQHNSSTGLYSKEREKGKTQRINTREFIENLVKFGMDKE